MKPGENISQGFGPVFMEPGDASASPGPVTPGAGADSEEKTIDTTTEQRSPEEVTDDELLSEAGVDLLDRAPVVAQTATTSEAAEYFNRTTQWLYYALETGRLVDETGKRLLPPKDERGRRVFDMDLLQEIVKANYRLGNVEPDELKTVLRRIRMTRSGIEWREREGWRSVPVTRYRHRWVPPERAEKVGGKWVLKEEFRTPSRAKRKDTDQQDADQHQEADDQC